MKKVVFINLRNRKLNKFKSAKAKLASPKVAIKTKKIRKTLRVRKVPLGSVSTKPITEQNKAKSPVSSGKTSPVPKVGKEVMASIIGHRRMFLRNRRLMNMAQ